MVNGGDDNGETLTAQETALYDRQIRVWGADAQRRLSKSHILVSGITGTTAEFCKNIVLAGVGSLTLVDDRPVTEDNLQSNFLINPDEVGGGRSLSELCCDSLRDFNTMVRVFFQRGDLSQFDGEFFDKFDAVVVSNCSLALKKSTNEKCRTRPRRVAFYAVDCRDSCGEIFVDLQNYTYSQKTSDGSKECCLMYSSFEEAIASPWKCLPKKVTKLYFAMRGARGNQAHAAILQVIERYESSEGRSPGEISLSDLPNICKMKKELCEAESVSETYVPVNILERLATAGKSEHPPVCAILGGILGQEVIKALSGKGDPLKSFFFFDTTDGKGIIEDIIVPAN